MMTFALIKLKPKTPLSESLAEGTGLMMYRAELIKRGYMYSEDVTGFDSPDEQCVCFGGYLTSETALADARRDPALRDIHRCLDAWVDTVSVEYFEGGAQDYCVHECPSSLCLHWNPWGGSSLMCGECSERMPRYRLDVTKATAELLADWEIQYHLFFKLWTWASGYYWDWANDQLHDIHSTINTMGLSVRKALEDELGIDVYYFLDKEVDAWSVCPQCSGELEEDSLWLWCHECRICTPDDLIKSGG